MWPWQLITFLGRCKLDYGVGVFVGSTVICTAGSGGVNDLCRSLSMQIPEDEGEE